MAAYWLLWPTQRKARAETFIRPNSNGKCVNGFFNRSIEPSVWNHLLSLVERFPGGAGARGRKNSGRLRRPQRKRRPYVGGNRKGAVQEAWARREHAADALRAGARRDP